MDGKDIYVGLDIGTTKICAIIGVKNEYNKLDIVGIGWQGTEGLHKGAVVNINKTVEAIQKALAKAEFQSKGFRIGSVNVGIAGMHISSIIHNETYILEKENEEVTKEDIDNMIKNVYKMILPPNHDILHIMPQEFQVDFVDGIKDPIGVSARRLQTDFHVITSDSVAIRNINKCVLKARTGKEQLEINNLLLEPIASSFSVLNDDEKEAGVVMVDIGGGTTDVAIFKDGILRRTAVIPFGGNVITSDISDGVKVLHKVAEKLKINFGTCLPDTVEGVISIPGFTKIEILAKNLALIIRARMLEITEYIVGEINESNYADQINAGVVITGGGALLKGAKELISQETKLDVRIGFPTNHVQRTVSEAVKTPSFSTCVGLVLSSLESINNPLENLNTYIEPKAGNKLIKKSRKNLYTKMYQNIKNVLLDNSISEGDS